MAGTGVPALLVVVLGRFLKRLTGVEVADDAWDLQAIDDHLRFNLRLLGEDENVVLESRDLSELKARFGEAARAAFAARAGRRIELQSLESFPDAGIPLQIPGAAGVPAFPALTAEDGTIQLKVYADRAEAAALHPAGVRALVDRAEPVVFALWGVRVPFANWLQPTMGVDAIWWSFPISAVVAMVASLAYYKWGRWREATMLPVDPDAIAIPSEVPAQSPAPVADSGARVDGDD